MKSKNIVRSLIVSTIAVSTFAPTAFAGSCFCLNSPYVGFELIQTNMNYKEGYGKGIFYKNPLDYNIFGGLKFSKYFGVEIGYEAMSKKGMQVNVGEGGALPGNIVMGPGESTTMESSMLVQHPYLGLFGEYDVWCMRFQALVGLSATHVKARTAILATEFGNSTPAEYNDSVRTYSKTQVIPMVKLAAVYDFTRCFAARLSFNYRNTNAIKINAQQGSGVAQIRFRDTVGVGLGLMYYFR